jgi:hypothetical protein
MGLPKESFSPVDDLTGLFSSSIGAITEKSIGSFNSYWLVVRSIISLSFTSSYCVYGLLSASKVRETMSSCFIFLSVYMRSKCSFRALSYSLAGFINDFIYLRSKASLSSINFLRFASSCSLPPSRQPSADTRSISGTGRSSR